jgi:hypothetical protein
VLGAGERGFSLFCFAQQTIPWTRPPIRVGFLPLLSTFTCGVSARVRYGGCRRNARPKAAIRGSPPYILAATDDAPHRRPGSRQPHCSLLTQAKGCRNEKASTGYVHIAGECNRGTLRRRANHRRRQRHQFTNTSGHYRSYGTQRRWRRQLDQPRQLWSRERRPRRRWFRQTWHGRVWCRKHGSRRLYRRGRRSRC